MCIVLYVLNTCVLCYMYLVDKKQTNAILILNLTLFIYVLPMEIHLM